MLGSVIGKVVERVLARRGMGTRAPQAGWREGMALEEMEGRRMLAGDGLTGTYFDNDNFTGATKSRIDATVNFGWGNSAPVSGIAGDTFTARWTGQVEAPASGAYTFYTQSDDGVRLRVNGQTLIDRLVPQSMTEHSGVIELEAGQEYEIGLDYFERYGSATVKLLWSSASTPKQVIPSENLVSGGILM